MKKENLFSHEFLKQFKNRKPSISLETCFPNLKPKSVWCIKYVTPADMWYGRIKKALQEI